MIRVFFGLAWTMIDRLTTEMFHLSARDPLHCNVLSPAHNIPVSIWLRNNIARNEIWRFWIKYQNNLKSHHLVQNNVVLLHTF